MIEGITKQVEYTMGIQQGDNMSPPLFIYVMRAAMETLKKLDEERKKLNYKFFLNQRGRLTNQPTKTLRGTKSFNVSNILFINNAAIICETRNDINIISQSILNHLTNFGLQMHTENKQNKSKLEEMYFPKSITEVHMTKNLPPPIQLNNGQITSDTWNPSSLWAQLQHLT